MNELCFIAFKGDKCFEILMDATVLSTISGVCKVNTAVDREVAFIWQKSGKTLLRRHNMTNVKGHKIEDSTWNCSRTNRKLVELFFSQRELR